MTSLEPHPSFSHISLYESLKLPYISFWRKKVTLYYFITCFSHTLHYFSGSAPPERIFLCVSMTTNLVRTAGSHVFAQTIFASRFSPGSLLWRGIRPETSPAVFWRHTRGHATDAQRTRARRKQIGERVWRSEETQTAQRKKVKKVAGSADLLRCNNCRLTLSFSPFYCFFERNRQKLWWSGRKVK